MNFEHYLTIKDKYCICYFGHNKEYITQLRLIRPIIINKFPELIICLSCRKEYMYLLNGEPYVYDKDFVLDNKRQYGHIKEIKSNLSGPHPIKELIDESEIDDIAICKSAEVTNKLCIIYTDTMLPTQPPTKDQINELRTKAMFAGFEVWVNPDKNAYRQAGWIIAPENEMLFESAAIGIKTTLIPTGIGTNLYKMMFPAGEVLKL